MSPRLVIGMATTSPAMDAASICAYRLRRRFITTAPQIESAAIFAPILLAMLLAVLDVFDVAAILACSVLNVTMLAETAGVRLAAWICAEKNTFPAMVATMLDVFDVAATPACSARVCHEVRLGVWLAAATLAVKLRPTVF